MSKKRRNKGQVPPDQGPPRQTPPNQSQPKRPVTCKTANCSNPPAPGSRFCPLCDIAVRFHRQVDKSNRRGDTLGALVNTGLAFLFNGIREGRVAAPTMENPFGNFVPRPQHPQPPPPRPSPFTVLGLDPKTATEKDVRRIQRGAAEMWHSDKGGGPDGEARLAEINAAAAACLKEIRKRAA